MGFNLPATIIHLPTEIPIRITTECRFDMMRGLVKVLCT